MVFVHKVCFAATCCCNALWVFKLPLKSRHVHRINLPKRAKLWIISPMCIDMWAYGIVSYFAHSTLGFLFFFSSVTQLLGEYLIWHYTDLGLSLS